MTATDVDFASALAAPPDGLFSDAELEGLPDVVARYFSTSLAPGTPLVPAVKLTMRGRIKVGRWLPFTATELLNPRKGFVWSVRAAGPLVVGSDRYLAGEGAMRMKLFGLIPVVNESGTDLARSAAGRAGGESVWAPASTLPRYGARWEAHGDTSATVRFAVDDTRVTIRYEFDDEGRIRSGAFDRWGDPDRTGEFGWHPFGGEITAHRTFGGITVPSAGCFGWHYGTDRWPEGEFFRYELSSVEPLSPE